jgi:hypothetical protein
MKMTALILILVHLVGVPISFFLLKALVYRGYYQNISKIEELWVMSILWELSIIGFTLVMGRKGICSLIRLIVNKMGKKKG